MICPEDGCGFPDGVIVRFADVRWVAPKLQAVFDDVDRRAALTNTSDDPEQDFFSDGLSQDLIAALADET